MRPASRITVTVSHRLIRMNDRYPTPQYRRLALAPGLLGAIVALAGIPLIDTGGFTVILFAVSILALIVAVFAWQATQWWWSVIFAGVAIVWNPVVPLTLDPETAFTVQFAAAAIFIAGAITIRTRNTEDRNKR